jgi:hypothetical protein
MPIPIPVLGTVFYEPIKAVRTVAGNASVPRIASPPEANGLATQIGVPMRIVNGFVQECTFVAADVIYEMSLEPGHNLTAAGAAQAGLSEYSAPNQPNSLIIPIGSHIRLGTMKGNVADGLNIFSAAVKYTTLPNPATGVVGVSQIFQPSLIQPGVYYSLVKDATSGFWYVDLSTTIGNAAVAQLIGVDDASPNDGVNGTRVFFMIKSSQRFFQ